MKKNSIYCVFSFVFSLFLFNSCMSVEQSDVSETQLNEIADAAQSAGVSEQVSIMAEGFVDSYTTQIPLSNIGAMRVTGQSPVLPQVSKLSAAGISPQIYNVYFGNGLDNNYIGTDGNTYSGNIIVKRYGSYAIGDTVRSSEGKDFYQNKNKIFFKRSVINGGDRILKIKANDSILYQNGKISYKKWYQMRSLIEQGKDRKKYWTLSWSFTGNSYGKLADGRLFSMEITKPLIIMDGYTYYVSGTQENTLKGIKEVRDYGTGVKDSIYTSTLNGVTKTKYLKWSKNSKNDSIVSSVMNGVTK